MSKRPPREGARWGDDPPLQPTIIPEPEGPNPEYIKLSDKYGSDNLERALAILRKTQKEYPHLSILKKDTLQNAAAILSSARRSIDTAAKDGRPHTMPETLNLVEKHLGGFLVQNPQLSSINNINWTYGDEHLGHKANQEKEKKDDIIIASVLAISVGGLIYTWVSTGDFFSGLIIGVLIFFGIGMLFGDQIGK